MAAFGFSFLKCTQNYVKSGFGMMGLESLSGSLYNRTHLIGCLLPPLSKLQLGSHVYPAAINPVLNYRSYSSFFVGKGDKARDTEVPAASGGGEPVVGESDSGGSDLVDMAKESWKSTVDAITYVGERAKEASNEVTPRVQELLESHPYLIDVIVPVSGTLTGTVLAWVVLPRILRRLHKYSTQGPAALLSGTTLWGPVPYERSFWGALEDPMRYVVTFMAFSQIAVMIAPTTVASQYIGPSWRGAVAVSFVWFLRQWKSNVIARALEAKNIGIDRAKLLTLDKISSVGLFGLGGMALAEACGVAVQSILTVGGVGGVDTAFAARDILGNILSGLSVQISQPFSLGDTIKAGSVEGQVVEMGLATTSLSAEKFPIIVPNSTFSNQGLYRTANDEELELENEFVTHYLSALETLYRKISSQKTPISIQEFLDIASRLHRSRISDFYEFLKQKQLYVSHEHLLGHLLPSKILVSKWEPPRKGQYVVNCDGSVRNVEGKIAAKAGYVIRDFRGHPITAGSVRLPLVVKSSEAERAAIGLGLLECVRWKCEEVIVRSDCESVVSYLSEESFLVRPKVCEFKFVPRELNRVADALASYDGLRPWSDAHFVRRLRDLLDQEASGKYYFKIR